MHNTIPNWDGGTLSTYQYGHGEEALLLIHGWACNQVFWNDVIKEIRGKKIITLDLAGHGESVAGKRQWTISEFAKDITVAVEYYGLHNYHLVGHSMGGMVALQAAADVPFNIKTVVQLDTFVFDYGFLDTSLQQNILDGFNEDFNKAVLNLVKDTSGSLDTKIQTWIHEQMTQIDAGQARLMFSHYMKFNPEIAMEKVKGKLCWLSSGLINTDSRSRYARFLEKELILPQTGHFLGQEAPQKVTKALEYLLAHE